MGAGAYALFSAGQFDLISLPLLLWFVVFLLLAVLMYGSIFIMIGAACTSLEESQTLMQPVMTFLAVPLMASPLVIRAPDGPLSVVLSLIPTATPFLMLTRLAIAPGPAAWQLVLGLVLTSALVVACVFAAGRIFRIGLLMQGKPPNLPELLRWIRR
jgi:ABC-2 type transport system permease protein